MHLPHSSIKVYLDTVFVPREGDVLRSIRHTCQYELRPLPYFWPMVHNQGLQNVLTKLQNVHKSYNLCALNIFIPKYKYLN